MSMFVPSYLYLSRNQVWYFRWPIPRQLSPAGSTVKHIRLSLRTRNPKEALRLSRHLEYHAMSIGEQLAAYGMDYIEIRKALKNHFSKWLAERKAAMDKKGLLSSVHIGLLENQVTRLQGSIERGNDDYATEESLIDELNAFIKKNNLSIQKDSKDYDLLKANFKLPYLSFCKEVLAYNQSLKNYDLSVQQDVYDASPHQSGITLKQAINDFIAERMSGNEWGGGREQSVCTNGKSPCSNCVWWETIATCIIT
jgi:hypothetical protein